MIPQQTKRAPLWRSPLPHAMVYGVHGAHGTTGWTGLFTRRDLASTTEAVEWAHLPPGAVSGEHRHTRTEEIYLILEGEGDYVLDGQIHAAKPGFLALMTPGHTHGLRNAGAGPLNWWVIETLTPETQAVLNGQSHSPRTTPMTPHVADLTTTPRVETADSFTGPLAAVERHTPHATECLGLEAKGMEIACFLNRGAGRLRFADTEVELTAPYSFLIPMSGNVLFEAQEDAEIYAVYLKVGQP